MVTSFNRGNLQKGRKAWQIVDTDLASGGGPYNKFYALDPTLPTSILITHHTSDTVQIEVTNTLDGNDDLENAAVHWGEVYNATDGLYLAGDSMGLTGVQLTSTPNNGAITVTIIQYRKV